MAIADQDWEGIIRERLSPGRYLHCQAVARAARELACRFGLDVAAANTAGWLHDYARELPTRQLLHLGRQRGLIEHRVEELYPVLLHAPLGACLVKEDLGLTDPGVLRAIALHTVGGVPMGALDQILYLADAISDDRTYPGLAQLRQLARVDLQSATVACLEGSLVYASTRGLPLHPNTAQALQFLKIN